MSLFAEGRPPSSWRVVSTMTHATGTTGLHLRREVG